MDRLVCGDVGFGKTEVALRAAFVAAMSGLQVAVVVPTTLLARQHYKTFTERFKGLPIRVAQASRLVGPKELAAVKEGLKSGADRHRRRHARAARQVDQFRPPRPADHRRGAALRRHPQGAPEEAARGRARADAVGDADPAHAAIGAVGRARVVAHHHAADGPPRRAHLHLALRSRHRARCAAPRALPRRPELLRRAAHLRHGGGGRVPARGRARS